MRRLMFLTALRAPDAQFRALKGTSCLPLAVEGNERVQTSRNDMQKLFLGFGDHMTYEENKQKQFFLETALPHLDAVYDSALRLAGNEADAEDLAQTTFLKAYRFFDKFKQGTDCKAWLLTILKNTFINQYRRRSRGPLADDLPLLKTVRDWRRWLAPPSERADLAYLLARLRVGKPAGSPQFVRRVERLTGQNLSRPRGRPRKHKPAAR